MQQSLSVNLETAQDLPRRLAHLLSAASLIICPVLISGCGEDSKQTSPLTKTHKDVSLTLVCPDKAFLTALSPAARSWAERTGAKIAIKLETMSLDDDADIGIIDAPELGFWADREKLKQVPVSLRAPDNPFQWTGILPAYREQLIVWGGQAQAIPLAGEGYVIVYRADRLKDPKVVAAFNAQFSHNPAPPTTWDEFAAIATVFASIDGKPSLPPCSNSELASLFFRIAACYDRKVQRESYDVRNVGGLEALSFQFDLTSSKPRLSSPAFQASADWFANLATKKCIPPIVQDLISNPALALANNEASIAVLSLAQLARMPRDNGSIPERFGIAALPGTQVVFDPENRRPMVLAVPNYVPYFAGGRLGVVRSHCKNSDAAFELLAELGGPTRSTEIVSASDLGAGPFRNVHLDHERIMVWYGYGFDAARSDALRNALLQNVQLE